MNQTPLWKSPTFLGFVVFAGWCCFYRLGDLPVRLWDESRQAMNVLEMIQSGNWLYSTFNGAPDFYNTKPILLIWLQSLSALLFGFSEWSLRLPTALAGMATALLIYGFLRRETKNEWTAALAGLSLMCAPGWIDEHVVRSGDYDALLCLFLTASWISFYRFDLNGSKRAALAFTVFTFLALFTKSTAGLMLLPGLFLWGLFSRNIWNMLRIGAVWRTAAVMVLLLGSWYAAHEYYTPGYLNTAWNNEVVSRFLHPNEGHEGPWYFYLRQLALTDFPYWPPALAGFVASLWLLRSRLAAFVAWLLIAFLLPLSMSATKIEWYAAPALPMLAVGFGMLLAPATVRTVRIGIFSAGIIAIAAIFSQTTLQRLKDPIELRSPGPEDELSLYLQGRHPSLAVDSTFRVLTADYSPTVMLYTRWPGRHNGVRTIDWKQLDSGNRVIAWHAVQLDSLKAWYGYQLIQQAGHLHKLQITGRNRTTLAPLK
ncbi:MAG: glycosyltransferase family 39 protein [Bacteroidetes bacterium]|nr:glycosyltransferase family 39 protein [Bacteroidota bacterium]